MDNFYKDATETLGILVKAVNGNNGIPRDKRHNPPVCYNNKNAFRRNMHLSTRRKVMPCNR